MAKKVGQLKKSDEEEVVKGRQDFNIDAFKKRNAAAVDEEGCLVIIPDDKFNWRKNNPLKKEQFASEGVFIQYQGLVSQQKSEFYAAKAKELYGKAERLLKFGSEKARKAANKLVKAKDQIKKLREQLLATGMQEAELDALIAGM